MWIENKKREQQEEFTLFFKTILSIYIVMETLGDIEIFQNIEKRGKKSL